MEKILIDEIRKIIQDDSRVLENEPMSRHTTFGIGGPADVIVYPKSDEIADLYTLVSDNGTAFTVIGNGSNILVSDDGIRGITAVIGKQMNDIYIDGCKITAEAGALLPSVAKKAQVHSLTGLEFASGIPGSMGGAVWMNAGAFKGEICDVLTGVTVYRPADSQLIRLPADSLNLSYRHSIFQEDGYTDDIILSVELALKEGDQDEIAGRTREISEKRRASQPVGERSAGSTFKRISTDGSGGSAEERIPSWKLIQMAGLKEASIGDAAVSLKHSGFLINRGHATATEMYSLINLVIDRVRETSGVTLIPEVKFIGKF